MIALAPITRRFTRILWLAGAAALSACAAVGPDYGGAPASTAELVSSWPSASTVDTEQADVTSAAPAADWWRQLQDPALNTLLEQAAAANYDLRIAAANAAAARAVLTQVSTRRLPAVDLNAGIVERRLSAASLPIGNSKRRFPTTSFGSGGLDLSWEVDLFGRVRRSIEAASADLGSIEAVRHSVLVSVSASVVRAYIDFRGARLRLDVAERNVAVQAENLDLVKLLAFEGAATELDVARARTLLLTSRATIPTFEARMRNALNRLTTLIGQAPGSLDAMAQTWREKPGLVAMPAFVAAGDPSDLLRRRPDIIAAERTLAASSARIGVATADLFPTVSFGTNIGVSAAPLSGLVNSSAQVFNAGPALTWNLFNRAAVYARIRQADAAAAANLARYESVVTGALQEVDSAINAYRNEQQRVSALQAAVESSRTAAELARLRYREGVEDFLDVLDAQRSLLVIEDQHAVSAINVAQRFIDIHLALGGGWDVLSELTHKPYVESVAR